MTVGLAAHAAAAAAALVAGGVNALAGGGTLITFPVLTAVGIPAVSANVTNTVALSPGYLGGALGQRADLVGQEHRVRRLAVAAGLGGLVGALLLIVSSEALFRGLVPFLILGACALLGLQDRLRVWVVKRANARHERRGTVAVAATEQRDPGWVVVPTFLVSIYGGYFGAGLGIMLLAVLGVVLDESLTRINAVKQWLSLIINSTAALFFVFSGKVYWSVAAVMAVAALVGGVLGGRLAGRLPPIMLRRVVIAFGVVVGIIYLVR